jgi:hypothetical protein
MDLPDDQMNADDLGLWLGRHRLVDDPQLAPGWVERPDDSRSPSWRWNAEPGQIPVDIPPGFTKGEASGQNLRCLLHTLSQLTQRTLHDAAQRQQVTTDGLANWLKRAMPEGTEGYRQLLDRQMIDVTDVLPTFTEAFGVRVQVFEFRHAGATTANGTFTFAHDGIYVHPPHGPQRDQAGYPTPILHVYWSYSHFEPLFTARYPVQLVLRQPLSDAGQGVPVGAVLPPTDQFRQIVNNISALLGGLPDRAGFLADHHGFEQRVNDLNQRRQTLFAQLGAAYDLNRAQQLRDILATLNDLHDQIDASSRRSHGLDFDESGLEGTGLEDGGLEEAVVRTPSGFYLRAEGTAGVQDVSEYQVAAQAFAPVAGAVVVHVHTDPASGRLVVGGRMLTAEEFNAEVLPHLRLPSRRLLVLVACRLGAVRPGEEVAAAQELADLSDLPVLAPLGDAFTTPAGAVQVREPGVSAEGLPVLGEQPASWRLFRPGLEAPLVLDSDLAVALAGLSATQPAGAPPVVVGQHAQPPRLPGREIRWLMDPLADDGDPPRKPGPPTARRTISWNLAGSGPRQGFVPGPPETGG